MSVNVTQTSALSSVDVTQNGRVSHVTVTMSRQARTHASTHAIGGSDPITPESIGSLSLASGGTMEEDAAIIFIDGSSINNGKIFGEDGGVSFDLGTGRVTESSGSNLGVAVLRDGKLLIPTAFGEQVSINWLFGLLYSSLNIISINYIQRKIYNADETLVIDYNGATPHFPLGATGISTSIPDNSVTNAKLSNISTNRIRGRITAGTGEVEDLTPTQARTILNVADGATANSSDAFLLARANHTGTQPAATISDFAAAALAAAPAQTSIVGISGTTAQFNTALTDGDFATDPGYQTRATSASLVTLTSTSPRVQFFTGTLTQTVELDTTSILVGHTFSIFNDSTNTITVRASNGSTIFDLPADTYGIFIAAINTPTTPANWSDRIFGAVPTSTNSRFQYSGRFDLNAGVNGTVFTLPGATTTLAGLGTTQTFTGKKTFSNLASPIVSSDATMQVFTATVTNLTVASVCTTFNFATAATATATYNICTGATLSGSTKTINLGTGGVTGSTTILNTPATSITLAPGANTTIPGAKLQNTTAATSGNQQHSPFHYWTGRGWKTNATAASQDVTFRAGVVPVQGTANPTGNFTIQSSVDGGAFGGSVSIDTSGKLTSTELISSTVYNSTLEFYIRSNTGICAGSMTRIGFSSGTNNANFGPDTSFSRNAAGVIEINNGTAGTLRDLTLRNLTSSGSITLSKTITAPATTGAQTVNQTSGRVNFAAGATSLVVTNSLCTANSIIHCTIATNDSTATGMRVVAAAGSFTIHLLTAPSAETAVNFLLTN